MTTGAKLLGVDAAAKAFGVDPQTARRYYVDGEQAFDTDAVYAGLPDWWLYGGGGTGKGAKPPKNPKKQGGKR